MIQSNKDLYQEINGLIKMLKSTGNEDYAKNFEDALSISTIPSEVLGEIRLTLENINNTELPEQLNIKSMIKDSLIYLNKIL